MGRVDYLRVGFVYDVRATGDFRMKQDCQSDFWKYWIGEYGDGEELDKAPVSETKLRIKGGAEMIVWECWGQASADFLENSSWFYSYCDRLKILRIDYRQIASSDVNLNHLFYAVDAKGGANVHSFNSRIRTKKNDRDAGGVGFSVGSHKSDRRMVIYQRGHEEPAIEVQMRSRVLDPVYQLCRAIRNEDVVNASVDNYARLKVVLCGLAEEYVYKHTRKAIGDLANNTYQFSHEDTERVLEDVEGRYKALNAHAQQSFIEAVYEGVPAVHQVNKPEGW